MTLDRHTQHKSLIAPLRAAMYDFEESAVRRALSDLCGPGVVVHLCHPFGDLDGADAFYTKAYAPLLKSIPDLERRDTIVMAGPTADGNDWLGCGGYYTGTFTAPWLDIPATGHQVAMRFHEFYRFEDGKAVEIQALWDIPELMMQADAWPMAPSLGREWHVPGPATQDGIVPGPYDETTGSATCRLILDMLDHLTRHPAQGGPEVMELPKFWHSRMSWYGPAGIGTGRGIRGFRTWHQLPFLSAMPDRGQSDEPVDAHFFGDRNYAAVTGWPNMVQTVTHDGWLGIAPSGQRITLRSLDFWRVENGLIRENWVLVDLLHAFAQLGVDVFRRLREFNKARPGFDPETGVALS
ncbi:polyketide cyclase [Roseibium denhamense]|uniref:SnoaL-like polyketide cyclase n=1 Tax=Roseibium denhamense TaxID=76305 RepID=A0ABY1NBT9_9HYPH|nr:ester cyclase [Roseibium denhamense]MTI06619.1 polyketide cyclase [Roseibium denhamense]SMP05752.1 SnoaL-like polyketide cyclase [Roseibium denhamense]